MRVADRYTLFYADSGDLRSLETGKNNSNTYGNTNTNTNTNYRLSYLD